MIVRLSPFLTCIRQMCQWFINQTVTLDWFCKTMCACLVWSNSAMSILRKDSVRCAFTIACVKYMRLNSTHAAHLMLLINLYICPHMCPRIFSQPAAVSSSLCKGVENFQLRGLITVMVEVEVCWWGGGYPDIDMLMIFRMMLSVILMMMRVMMMSVMKK